MTDEPFEITYGHSKDMRPDLKQFLVEMLCVERNIPLFGATRDGNASDKTLNNELLRLTAVLNFWMPKSNKRNPR